MRQLVDLEATFKEVRADGKTRVIGHKGYTKEPILTKIQRNQFGGVDMTHRISKSNAVKYKL